MAACPLLALAIYWTQLDNFFVWDDFLWLQAVRDVSLGEFSQRAFASPRSELFDPVTPYWRPLTDFYFYGAKSLGLNPEPYHSVNVFVHGVASAVAILFVWRVSRSVVAGCLTGLLFVMAPTYGIGVIWISQAADVFGGAFLIGTLTLYAYYLTTERTQPMYLAGVIVLAVLALLAREATAIMIVLLPGLVLALGPYRKRRVVDVVRSLLILLPLVFAFALFIALRESGQTGSSYEFGTHMPRQLWDFLNWMVLPFGDPTSWTAVRIVLTVAYLYAGVMTFVFREWRLAYFFGWSIVALLPFAPFRIDVAVEEFSLRYTYLATLPFTAFVVYGVVVGLKRAPHAVAQPARWLAALAAIAALVVTPLHTNSQQAALTAEAASYRVLSEASRALCDPVPPGGSLVIVNSPLLSQLYLNHALNLNFDRVGSITLTEIPAAGSFLGACVIAFDKESGKYQKVDR